MMNGMMGCCGVWGYLFGIALFVLIIVLIIWVIKKIKKT